MAFVKGSAGKGQMRGSRLSPFYSRSRDDRCEASTCQKASSDPDVKGKMEKPGASKKRDREGGVSRVIGERGGFVS